MGLPYATVKQVEKIATEIVEKTGGGGSGDSYTKEEIDALLRRKQDELVSGLNIKTINTQSILGEGDIKIESGEGGEVASVFQTRLFLCDDEGTGTFIFSGNTLANMKNPDFYYGDPEEEGTGPAYFHDMDYLESFMRSQNCDVFGTFVDADGKLSPARLILTDISRGSYVLYSNDGSVTWDFNKLTHLYYFDYSTSYQLLLTTTEAGDLATLQQIVDDKEGPQS